MKTLVQPLSRIALALCLLTPLSQAMAADVANPVEAQYQEDRLACMAMTTASVVSREACLREAGAVREAALGGTLPEESSPAAMRRNAPQCALTLRGAPRSRGPLGLRAHGAG